jgi:hypothetical protein
VDGCFERVVTWDMFPVRDGERLRVRIESRNSAMRQGVRLTSDFGIVAHGSRRMTIDLWTDARIECRTRDGRLIIHNVWEAASGLSVASAMIVDRFGDRARRYRCNNLALDAAFDRLVFVVERLTSG